MTCYDHLKKTAGLVLLTHPHNYRKANATAKHLHYKPGYHGNPFTVWTQSSKEARMKRAEETIEKQAEAVQRLRSDRFV